MTSQGEIYTVSLYFHPQHSSGSNASVLFLLFFLEEKKTWFNKLHQNVFSTC